MICGLSKLAQYNSKNIIKDWIAELGHACTSISVEELRGSNSCRWAVNTLLMSHHLTPRDAILRIATTTILCPQSQWICHTDTSCISYSNTSTLYCVPYLNSQMWLRNMKCSIAHHKTQVSRHMQDSPVHLKMVKVYSILVFWFHNLYVASVFWCAWNLWLTNDLKPDTKLQIVFWWRPIILRWGMSGNLNSSCRLGISWSLAPKFWTMAVINLTGAPAILQNECYSIAIIPYVPLIMIKKANDFRLRPIVMLKTTISTRILWFTSNTWQNWFIDAVHWAIEMTFLINCICREE